MCYAFIKYVIIIQCFSYRLAGAAGHQATSRLADHHPLLLLHHPALLRLETTKQGHMQSNLLFRGWEWWGDVGDITIRDISLTIDYS